MDCSGLKQWATEVFGGMFRAIYFWLAVIINIGASLILEFVRPPHQIPPVVAWCLKFVPIPLIFAVFVLSNIAAYCRLFRKRAELAEELDGIIVDLEKTEAGEFLSPMDTVYGGPAHHHVKIFLTLVARNRDARHAGTLELITCDTDLRSGTDPDLLWFEREQLGNYIDSQDKRRRVENGDVRELRVSILYRFPITSKHIDATCLEGTLKLQDHRKRDVAPIRFSASIFKNEVAR
jgi:hypothetical protein